MVEKEGISISEGIKEFINFIGDLRLIAFNAEFDMAFLSKEAALIGKQIYNPASCALDMVKRAWPGRKSYKLESLIKDGDWQENKIIEH